MPINPNEELTPETSQEAFTARTYDPMQPVPEEAETNMEAYIKYLYDKTQRLPEKPDTREEYFMMIAGQNIGPGSDVEPLRVTENGTYSEAGKAYSPVTVEVPLPTNANERKSVTSYPVTDSANYPLPKCDVTVTDADKCEVIVTTDNTITEDSGVYIERQSGGGSRELDEIVGGSVVWNQLIPTANKSFTNTTVDSAGTSFSMRLRQTYSPYTTLFTNFNTGIGVVDAVIAASSSFVGISLIHVGATNNINIYGDADTVITSGHKYLFHIKVLGNTVNTVGGLQTDNFMFIDLTALFGSTIADYIYSLEQSTAGSGIAWLKSYGYLTEDYYGYTANKIESVSVARHITKDSNDSVIGSYAINPITLRGIPKLNASNQLYYDGDVYEASGRVTRKYGIVDLGTLTWSTAPISGGNQRFYAMISNVKPTGDATKIANIICPKYIAISNASQYGGTEGICIHQSNHEVNIYDTNYLNSSTSVFKTAMSGVYLVYELATPTYEDSSPFEANQIVDANGTEEYIDAGVEAGTRDVAIPVGHDTKYYNGKAYVKPLTAGTSDTVSMADMGIMPTSPMYIEANGTLDVEYWKSNS